MKTQEIIKLKTSKTNIKIDNIFKNRFSPRVFLREIIPEDDLKIIFEATRFTPSSYNLQPWYFYVGKKGTDGYEKIASTLVAGNQWARSAPVLILACFIEGSQYDKNEYAKYDLGQAVITLVYQAQALGYYSHQMAGFDRNKAKKIVNYESHQPWVVIALGKIGDYEKADQKIVEMDNHKPERKQKIFEFI
ncbi:MAG: nitroreductase family protein [Patescibacteria group bacterium]|nr:nitroreductase family protein [Patescibacteria group bacterium]